MNGRGWAYAGLVLGGIVSGTMNVLHSLQTPSPIQGFMVVISGLLPVFLYVAIEVLTRVAWKRTAGHVVARVLGVLPIAGVTAYVSWMHGYGLLRYGGESMETAAAWPAAIDGLMIMSTVALLLTRTRTQDDVRTRTSLADRVRAVRTAVLDIEAAATGVRTPEPALPFDPYVPTEPYSPGGIIDTGAPVLLGTDEAIEPAPTRTRTVRRAWDRAEAERLIKDTLLSDREIAVKVSADPADPISHTPIYRLRQQVRERAGL